MSSLTYTHLDSTIDGLDMLGLADKLRELREGKKELEDFVKEVNAAIDATEQALVAAMVEEEMQNFTRNGRQFILNSKQRTSAKSGMQAELYAWLKKNGYGDLVKETVHAQTLDAFGRELTEELGALPETLEPLVNVYEKVTVQIRKR